MIIKYISDIHLEFLQKIKPTWVSKLINSDADVLVLAGDIGYPMRTEYSDFLINVNKIFEKTFLITGNHEYYSSFTIEQNNNKIKQIIEENNLANVKFLLNEYEDYKGYRFVGSTLWSKIYNPNFLINDFKQIPGLTVEKYNMLHQDSINFIDKTIKETPKPIIMITHHLPSHSLTDPKYASYADYNQCFSSDLDHIIKEPIKAWFYGHTHIPSFKEINGVKLLCNPIGYPEESSFADFNRKITIEDI